MHPSYSQYHVISNPTGLFVSLSQLKKHLRLNPTDTTQDDYLTLLIQAATTFGEKRTRRIFINIDFLTYRDFFLSIIELRKSPFQALISFEYLKSDGWVAVPSTLYYITNEKDYSKIVLKTDATYPDDIDDRLQAVRIKFTAGLAAAVGDIYTSMKADLIVAVMNHIAVLYENRGDCDDASLEDNLPNTSKLIYSQYRIPDIIGEIDYF